MPRQRPRAEREAVLGRYQDESYHNQALADARAAWDTERTELEQHIDQLERDLKRTQQLRATARKAVVDMAENSRGSRTRSP